MVRVHSGLPFLHIEISRVPGLGFARSALQRTPPLLFTTLDSLTVSQFTAHKALSLLGYNYAARVFF